MWTDFQNSLTWLMDMKKLIFYSFWPELQMAAITPKDKIFDWNLVGIVFTTCRIGILGLIVNLRAMGLTYPTSSAPFWESMMLYPVCCTMLGTYQQLCHCIFSQFAISHPAETVLPNLEATFFDRKKIH